MRTPDPALETVTSSFKPWIKTVNLRDIFKLNKTPLSHIMNQFSMAQSGYGETITSLQEDSCHDPNMTASDFNEKPTRKFDTSSF